MIGRVSALAVAAILAACAASDQGAVSERAPPPPVYAEPTPAQTPAPGVAAPGVVVAQADAPAERRGQRGGDDDIVVPGQIERQVPPPAGDPRTAAERMEDIRNWDRCVMEAQSVGERDPLRPSLESPEETCRTQLGMANRTAVPNSRLRRQP